MRIKMKLLLISLSFAFLKSCPQVQSKEADINMNCILETIAVPESDFVNQLEAFLCSKNYAPRSQTSNFTKNENFDLNSAIHSMVIQRQMTNLNLASNYLKKHIMSNYFLRKQRDQLLSKQFYIRQNDSTTNRPIDEDSTQVYRVDLLTRNKDASNERCTRKICQQKAKRDINKQKSIEVSDVFNQNHPNLNTETSPDGMEDGVITGYALTHDVTASKKYTPIVQPYMLPLNTRSRDSPQNVINKKGYELGGAALASSQFYHQSHPVQHLPEGKELNLQDITYIALTTLAFLSFGMFILQVVMGLTMNKDETDSTLTAMNQIGENMGDGTEEIRRIKRSVEMRNVTEVNKLAERVLFSIGSTLKSIKDSRYCNHYWSLCINNQIAIKEFKNLHIWIPVWSLGISWFSVPSLSEVANRSNFEIISKSLKAILTGLLLGNCEEVYGSTCKL